jgi:DNA polymerase-3 subunit delta'
MPLFIHPVTRKALEAMKGTQPHSILLHGKEGIGLRAIAREFFEPNTAQVLEILPEKNEKVDLEKGVITVESIRRVYDAVKTSPKNGRVVIIDYAERMGVPAQNAFLKLLEEPPVSTQFILLSHTPELLLPTIRSRTQTIEVRPITLEDSKALLESLKVTDSTKMAQLLFIAKGLPAQLTSLATDEAAFTARAAIVRDARQLVSGSAYDRLLLAKKYKDSRETAMTLIQDATQQITAAISQHGDERALHTLEQLNTVHRRLTEQGNVRLQLSSLVVL